MPQNRNLSGCQIFKPHDLPSDWDCEPLSRRLALAYGRALPEDRRKPGPVDVYGSNGIVGSHDTALLEDPGILVGRKGTVGAVHFAPRPFWPIDTVYYVVPRGMDDVRYLRHLLDYLPLRYLNAATGVPGLSRRDAYALRGAFPPHIEQTAIARILDALDLACERTHTAALQAREAKRAVLQRFFYDALGETAYADRPRRKLPAGWSLAPMATLLAEDPKNGMSPEASSQPPGTPTFSIAAIREGRVDLTTRDNLKYARLPDHVIKKFAVRRGDVLIVRGNANPELVGRAGIVGDHPPDCIYPDITKRVVFRTDGLLRVSPAFGLLTWNHPIVHNQVLRRAKTSNGTLKINNRDVKQIVLPVPPDHRQEELVRIVAVIDSLIDGLNAVMRVHDQLKRSLLRDLLNGHVRVPVSMMAENAVAS